MSNGTNGEKRKEPKATAKTFLPSLPVLSVSFFFFPFFLSSSFASETATFLKIVPGARPMAMGQAFTAVADDLNALTLNPAGLSQLSAREVSITHDELFAGTHYDFLSYAHPLRDRSTGASLGTLAFGAQRLYQGSLEGRDESGQPNGSFDASDMAFQMAYSRRLAGTRSMLGASLKYLESRIADASARTLAVDVGYLHAPLRAGLPLSWGVSIQNLGPGVRYADATENLPLAVAAGAGLRLPAGFMLSADVRHSPRTGQTSFGLGTEYSILPMVTLRGGYLSTMQSSMAAGGTGFFSSGPLQGLGMGFGLRMGRVLLDYSFSPYGELGNVQRLSLGARF